MTVGAPPGGPDTLTIDIPTLALGSTATVTYNAVLLDSVQPGVLQINAATATFSSAPGPNGHTGTLTAAATIDPALPFTFSKTLIGGSDSTTTGGNVAIGETVTYDLTATLSEGTQRVVFQDVADAGLLLETATLLTNPNITVGGTSVSTLPGQSLLYTVGTADAHVPDSHLVLQVTALVEDLPGNVSGHVLNNAGTATISALDGSNAVTHTGGQTVTVVAPVLDESKTVDIAQGQAGTVATYTVTIAQDHASTATAYNLDLRDALSAEQLNYVANSASATIGGQWRRSGIPAFQLRAERRPADPDL